MESLRRVAISGCNGMIGGALQAQLAGTFEVRPLVRPDSDGEPHSSDLSWDPSSGLRDPSQLEGCQALVHLAGRSIGSARWSETEKRRLRESRVDATERLVSQILELDHPPQTVISASAVGIYGDCGQEQVDEHQTAADDFLGQLAADWEATCVPLISRGIRVVHPRFGLVLSRSGGALAKMLPIFRSRLAGPLGSGQQLMSWISLSDTIRALEFVLANANCCGAMNFVAPNPITNAEFTQQLAAAINRPALIPVPSLALKLVLGEMAGPLLLSSCRATPSSLIEHDFQFRHPTLDKFLADEFAGP